MYENEYELKALQDRIFSKFAEPVNRESILAKTVKMAQDADVCTHYAKGKSIFYKDGIMSMTEQGDFFAKMYDKDYTTEAEEEDHVVEGQEVYRDENGEIQTFDGHQQHEVADDEEEQLDQDEIER